jgi:NTE family protein
MIMLRMRTSNLTFIIHPLRTILKNSLLILFLFSFVQNSESQEIHKRPSIGLVLSGGGAHGIAHLGVIKVMEETGLRPDYITGVSMGSIIGGLYSLGYTADSLYKLLKTINWNSILSNKIPENKVIFLEKAHFYHSIISLPLSFKKVKLPSGLINGQQFENTLSFYTWPAADINDFSRLPIPFMCLAADIITFKKVDLKTGYLADALRASSAVPSIFTPIKIDTLLLLDGGLIRNFAACEAKEMGADIIIGSYCGFHGLNEDELQSASGIMKQIGLFRSLDDFEKQKKIADVLIEPKTDDFPINEFENVDSLYRKGYEAALPFKGYFIKLADSLNLIGSQRPIENIFNKQFYKFSKIEITGNKIYSDYQILGVLDIEPEEKVDKYLLRDRIELLYGKAWFDKVKYRIVPRNDSLILVIDCKEKPKAMFYGSVHYDNSIHSGLILELSVKNLITQSSVINLNSFVGQYYRFEFNYLQFVDRNQKFALSANFYTDNTLIPMLELNGERVDAISRNFVPGFSIHRRLGLNHMMSVYANYENMNIIPHYSSDDHLKSLTYNYFTGTYDYQINTVNTKHFPKKGVIFNVSVSTSKLLSGITRTDTLKTTYKEDSNSDFHFDRFFIFHGSFKQYFSPASKLTFSIGGDALLITDSDSLSAQNNFYLLGGIEQVNRRSIAMTGFHSNEIPVKKLAGISAGLDFELIENLHISAMADIFTAQETNRDNGYSLLTGFGIGVGYMSIIGPIKIGIMHGNYAREEYFNKTKGYISIGFNF